MRINKLAERFQGRGPLLNIVLDGWGIGAHDEGDAIFLASTPQIDFLTSRFPHTAIQAHGPHVGLPSFKDIGGSEVGHVTMGAGRIFPQGPTRIKEMIDSGTFFEASALNLLIDNCVQRPSALHLIGLLSDGNVHSHMDHFYAVIDHAVKRGVLRLYVHALLDGRDVPYQSALSYLEPMEAKLASIRREYPGRDYAIASGGGREVITMDRDQIWEKVRLGWEVHVRGREGHPVASAAEAIAAARAHNPDMVDQDLPPFIVVRGGESVAPIVDGDSVIFMNFRGDRAIEFSRAMVEDNFTGFDRGRRPEVAYAGMMVYDEDTNLPPLRIVGATHVKDPFGKRILELGLRQFRLAESQKYAHVTFFYNGGYREPLDPDRELYHLIPSDKVNSFAAVPAMKAAQIADKACALIRGGEFQFGLINFANADMVGHTGDIAATMLGVEAIDHALGHILDALRETGGLAIITADHGNADEMISNNPQTQRREPNTRHSLNPVPLILFDPIYGAPGDYRLIDGGDTPLTLSRIAATNYILMGRTPPDDIDPPLFVL